MAGIDIFGSLKGSTSLGTRLNNMKTSLCPNAQQILTVNLDDTEGVKPVSNYGLGLLNIQDASTLLNTLINTDSSITISDLGTGHLGQIDVKIDNTLIQQWKVLYTQVMNELRTLSIIPTTTTCDIGSVASPYRSIYASNIYQPSGSNALTFNTNAVERLRIASNGYVGIGTTTPSYNFHIRTNGTSTWTDAESYRGLMLTDNLVNRIVMENTSNAVNQKLLVLGNEGNDFRIGVLNDGGSTWFRQYLLKLSLSTGSIGINTGTPTAGSILTVNGNTSCIGNIYPDQKDLRDIGTTSHAFNGVYCNGLIQPSASNAMTFNCNSAERMRITSLGFVGVGTTNPFSLFDVSSSSINPIMTLATTTYTNNPASATTVATLRMHNDKPQNDKFCEIKAVVRTGNHTPSIVFSTKNSWVDGITDRMIITEIGGVGIGTITPTTTLDVRGITSIKTGATVAGSFKIMVGTGVANDNTWIGFGGGDGTPVDTNDRARIGCYIPAGGLGELFFTAGGSGGTEIMRIKSTGMAIGTSTLTSGSILTVSGNTTCIGNILPEATGTRNLGSSTKQFNTLYCTNVGSSDYPLTSIHSTNFGSSTSPADNIYGNVWQTNTGSNLRCGNNLILMGLETLATPPWYDISCGSTIQMDTTNLMVGGKQTFDSTTKELVFKTTVSPALTEVERIRLGASLKTSVSIIPTDANRMLGSASLPFNTLYVGTILNPLSELLVGPLKLGSTTMSMMYVSSSNVKIGTNIGTERLVVDGNIKFSSAGNLLPIHNVSQIGTSNSDRFLSGYFGTVYANGVALTSDRRLKDNIKPITNGLSTVLRMKPVEYNMKGRVRLHTGFLADEMENLYNGEDWACFVQDNDEAKTQSLQYTEVVAVLVKAIQEMSQSYPQFESKVIEVQSEDVYRRLDEQKLINEQLLSKVNDLTSKVTDLENKNVELSNELEVVKTQKQTPIVKEAKIEIEDSDNGGITMIESLQERLYKSEQLISKQANMIKKLTVAVNKLLKSSE
jgi:hypothetical protein